MAMKNLHWTFIIGILLALGSCQKPAPISEAGLIPLPQEITDGTGTFRVTSQTGIRLVGTSEKLTSIGEILANSLRPATGFELPVSKDSGEITLELTGSGPSEAYELQISGEGVRITASGEAGLFMESKPSSNFFQLILLIKLFKAGIGFFLRER